MKFKKEVFGFMDMLHFKELVPNRQQALANGANTPLPKEYRTNTLAQQLHPGTMLVELVQLRWLTTGMKELTFRRIDASAFPFFRAGQYVSLQGKVGDSLVSRPYSIASSPREALENKLVLGIEDAGFFSHYLTHQAKVGDRFVMTEPTGGFHYETLRDKKQIVCIAGGSGITPFLSMAKSMIEGDEPYEMILFYGARTRDSLAYKDKLDTLALHGLKVVYVLSDEEAEGFEHGFITAELLQKYVEIPNVTFFLCGPPAMYQFIQEQLAPFQLPLKAVFKDATCCGNLEMDTPRTFQLTVYIRDHVYIIDAHENETLLTAMERAGIPAPNKCRAGGCGYCHSKLLKGEYLVAENRDGRRAADRKFDCIHPCVTYPKSNMEIDVPPAEAIVE